MEKYFTELPEDYVLDKVIDVKDDKKAKALFVIGSMVLLGLVFACFLPYLINHFPGVVVIKEMTFPWLILMIGLILYIILHELTHGLFYKIFTREKLTFGLTLTVAYCGVPNLYLKKVPALVSAIAPFVVFSFVFGIPLFFVSNYWYFSALVFLFASHISGCIGDLYCVILLAFKYKGKDVLVNDTGPKQSFYVKK